MAVEVRDRFRHSFPAADYSEILRRRTDRTYMLYDERFVQQCPASTAVIDQVYTTEAARGASFVWETVGTNNATATVAHIAGGGISFVTAGADNDQCILKPHQDALHSGLATFDFNTSSEPLIAADIVLPSIADCTVWVGLQSGDGGVGDTGPAAQIAEPADSLSVFFSDEGVSATNWTLNTSRSGTDTANTTTVAPAAEKVQRICLYLDAARKPQCFINGINVSVGVDTTALDASTQLIPYVGISALSAAAKTLEIRNVVVSQKYAT